MIVCKIGAVRGPLKNKMTVFEAFDAGGDFAAVVALPTSCGVIRQHVAIVSVKELVGFNR